MDPAKKAMWGWALYDWADSAFATTVMAGFFPVFFKQYWSAGFDASESTALLGLANSLAGILVALSAPILGAVADLCSLRKRFLLAFAYLGALATGGLCLVERGDWQLAVFCYVLGNLGFAGGNVFYDALLPEVAPRQKLDRVSAFGYALGYLGGGLLFGLNLVMVLNPVWFGLADEASAVRLSFFCVALWWGGFSLFAAFWLRENATARPGLATAVCQSFSRLARTLGRARHMRETWLFLLAYWFYIDGVDTVIRMAVDYGLSLGFAAADLMGALLMVQFVAFPAALAFGRLGQAWGAKKALLLAVAAYLGMTIFGAGMRQVWQFYVLAGLVGIFQGGIQALSRSLYSRLIPKKQSAEFFGFYNLMGKFAAIFGPALVGSGTLLAHSLIPAARSDSALAARLGILSVGVLFIAGGLLLYLVKVPANERGIPDRQSGNQPTS